MSQSSSPITRGRPIINQVDWKSGYSSQMEPDFSRFKPGSRLDTEYNDYKGHERQGTEAAKAYEELRDKLPPRQKNMVSGKGMVMGGEDKRLNRDYSTSQREATPSPRLYSLTL